ncbi:MAG TPA: rhodanese-like domain-containing protein [Gemmatimonadaceae bacterium]|nr:rhodanese-like domain-containing protein [Gemmatimonadaceae bacterium]
MADLDRRAQTDVTPQALHAELRAGRPVMLLDVREPAEWAIARLPSATLVPLGSLIEASPTLPRDADLVVYCHHGMRSDAAARWLREAGFARVRNLEGGIDRWSVEVDATLPRY